MRRDARGMVEELLNERSLLPDEATPLPAESCYAQRARRVQTLFGPIKLWRKYFHHARSHTGRSPLDDTLDLVRGHTPALAKLICRAATQSSSYHEAAQDLAAYSGLQLDARGFGRLVAELAPTLGEALATLPALRVPPQGIPVLYVSSDGTGVPMRREELTGVHGKQPDGSAHTREVKLGCVFTQSSTDEEGQPLRDPDSTSYMGTFEGCREAGILLRQEALRRGYGSAHEVVYLGDGAAWVWENARANFPGAVQILDFYHASEHAGTLAHALLGAGSDQAKAQAHTWCQDMKATSSATLIQQARDLLDTRRDLSAQQREEAGREIAYFHTHAQRTRYGQFRAKGYFIGSGVVEAGCKTVVGRRLKQSGMFWSQRGGHDLLSLRCLMLGPHFDAAWHARRPILAAQQAKARHWSPSPN